MMCSMVSTSLALASGCCFGATASPACAWISGGFASGAGFASCWDLGSCAKVIVDTANKTARSIFRISPCLRCETFLRSLVVQDSLDLPVDQFKDGEVLAPAGLPGTILLLHQEFHRNLCHNDVLIGQHAAQLEACALCFSQVTRHSFFQVVLPFGFGIHRRVLIYDIICAESERHVDIGCRSMFLHGLKT